LIYSLFEYLLFGKRLTSNILSILVTVYYFISVKFKIISYIINFKQICQSTFQQNKKNSQN